jgi:hypothetical protein
MTTPHKVVRPNRLRRNAEWTEIYSIRVRVGTIF